MMKKLILILLVCVSFGAFAQTGKDTSANSAKPHGMQFAEVLAQHKGALIVIDGKVYNGKIEDIKADNIVSMDFLKGEDAVGIYGPRSTNGVFLLTSKLSLPNDDELLPPPPKVEQKPMIVLDGKVITWEELTRLNPDDVEEVVKLNNRTGTAKYGKAGENGVMLITTKAAAKKQKENQKPKN
jgi:ABC-type Fe3+-hydroxamate transport system substrate-binding protein